MLQCNSICNTETKLTILIPFSLSVSFIHQCYRLATLIHNIKHGLQYCYNQIKGLRGVVCALQFVQCVKQINYPASILRAFSRLLATVAIMCYHLLSFFSFLSREDSWVAGARVRFLPKETQQQPGIDPGNRTWNLAIIRPMPQQLSHYCPSHS